MCLLGSCNLYTEIDIFYFVDVASEKSYIIKFYKDVLYSAVKNLNKSDKKTQL